jgi:hypothetical protein
MRKLATALLVVCTTASALAQGTVFFANRLSATDWAKVTLNGVGVEGAGYSAQLFAGPAGTAEGSLVAVAASLTSFRTGAGAGAWTSVTDVAIPGVVAGAQAALQVRVWANNGGTVTTYAAAVAAGNLATGVSAVMTSNPLGGGNPPTPSPNMLGLGVTDPLQAFSLTVIPEPSVLALGALGALALVLRRRKA